MQARCGVGTLLVHEHTRHIVGGALRTARNRQVDLIHGSVLVEEVLAPVGVHARCQNILQLAVDQVAVFVLVGRQLAARHEVELVGRGLRDTVLGVERDGGLAVARTLLGHDVHDAVRGACAVNRGGRRVFQYVHRLDVVGVQHHHVSRRDGRAVEQNERRGARVGRAYTVQADRRGRGRLTRRGVHLQTGDLALQCVGDVGRGFILQHFALHFCDGTDGGSHFVRRSVSDNRYGFDSLSILLEDHIDRGLTCDVYRLVLVTDERNGKRSVRGSGDLEAAVRRGSRSVHGAVDDNRGADDGVARLVLYGTAHLPRLSVGREAHRQQGND